METTEEKLKRLGAAFGKITFKDSQIECDSLEVFLDGEYIGYAHKDPGQLISSEEGIRKRIAELFFRKRSDNG